MVAQDFLFLLVINFAKMLLQTFTYINESNEEKNPTTKKGKSLGHSWISSFPPWNMFDVLFICLGSAWGLQCRCVFGCKPMLASPSPEQKGFLQMCGTPSPWKSGSKVFLFLSEASLCYCLWVISLGMFSTAEAVWADDKPNAADVWAVHIRGCWYGWQWLSRYVCYFTATWWRTAELVVSRLLVPTAVGGCWCFMCSCLLPVLSKAPDKKFNLFLSSDVWAVMVTNSDIKVGSAWYPDKRRKLLGKLLSHDDKFTKM